MSVIIDYLRSRDAGLLDEAVSHANAAIAERFVVLEDVYVTMLNGDQATVRDVVLRMVASQQLEKERQAFISENSGQSAALNGLMRVLGHPLDSPAVVDDLVTLREALDKAGSRIEHVANVDAIEAERARLVTEFPDVLETLSYDDRAILSRPINPDSSDTTIRTTSGLVGKLERAVRAVQEGAGSLDAQAEMLISEAGQVLEIMDGHEVGTMIAPLGADASASDIIAKGQAVNRFMGRKVELEAHDQEIAAMRQRLDLAMEQWGHGIHVMPRELKKFQEAGISEAVREATSQGMTRYEARKHVDRTLKDFERVLRGKAREIDRQASQAEREAAKKPSRREEAARRNRQRQTSQAGPAKGPSPAAAKFGPGKKGKKGRGRR